MKRVTSAVSAPTREQTEKRLRQFVKSRKFNFLQEQNTPVLVLKARCCGLTWSQK